MRTKSEKFINDRAVKERQGLPGVAVALGVSGQRPLSAFRSVWAFGPVFHRPGCDCVGRFGPVFHLAGSVFHRSLSGLQRARLIQRPGSIPKLVCAFGPVFHRLLIEPVEFEVGFQRFGSGVRLVWAVAPVFHRFGIEVAFAFGIGVQRPANVLPVAGATTILVGADCVEAGVGVCRFGSGSTVGDRKYKNAAMAKMAPTNAIFIVGRVPFLGTDAIFPSNFHAC